MTPELGMLQTLEDALLTFQKCLADEGTGLPLETDVRDTDLPARDRPVLVVKCGGREWGITATERKPNKVKD